MRTKLTLRLDEELIQRAKTYSRKSGKPISQIVADYFAMLFNEPRAESESKRLPPLTTSLRGVLRGARISKEDYLGYLEAKHK